MPEPMRSYSQITGIVLISFHGLRSNYKNIKVHVTVRRKDLKQTNPNYEVKARAVFETSGKADCFHLPNLHWDAFALWWMHWWSSVPWLDKLRIIFHRGSHWFIPNWVQSQRKKRWWVSWSSRRSASSLFDQNRRTFKIITAQDHVRPWKV